MMKKLFYFLSFITMLCVVGCSDDFTTDEYGKSQTKSSDTSRFLDISTTDITAMTSADFQAFNVAMKRMEVEYDGRFHIIQRTDYRNLNISKKLYWTVKQSCENGNRLSAAIHRSPSFPLTKNGNPETAGQTIPTDCMAYALYGMGADLSVTLPYIQQYHPDGVLLNALEAVVHRFLPNASRVPHPSSDGWWQSIPRPIIICSDGWHAVNCVMYTLSSGSAMIIDHQNGTSGGILGPNQIYCFFE